MQVSKRAFVATLSAAALAGSAATAVSALGHDGGRGHERHRDAAVLNASLAPSVPIDPVLNGSAAGGAPWVLRDGEAQLSRGGRLRVSVRGLIIPSLGTPGPVKMVSASLYCGGATTPVGTTPSAPISLTGNAKMQGQITVPAKCLAPVVLVHPNGNMGVYIAASGFGA
jgi:hypothetical protein